MLFFFKIGYGVYSLLLDDGASFRPWRSMALLCCWGQVEEMGKVGYWLIRGCGGIIKGACYQCV